MIILENTFLKSQIYDKSATMLFSYHYSVTKELFLTFADQAFYHNLKYIFPENFNSLSDKLIIL